MPVIGGCKVDAGAGGGDADLSLGFADEGGDGCGEGHDPDVRSGVGRSDGSRQANPQQREPAVIGIGRMAHTAVFSTRAVR